jgi:hypothetical protein
MENEMTEEKVTEKLKRHLFQIRRKDGSGTRQPYYSPNRDLAHIGAGLVKGAMISLEEKHWEPWLVDYMRESGVTYQDLIDTKAPLIFAKALNRIMQLESPADALEAEGFTELPPAIQLLFHARLGQVTLCAIFSAVKDVGEEDSAPPLTIQHLFDDVNEAFGGFIAAEDSSAT